MIITNKERARIELVKKCYKEMMADPAHMAETLRDYHCQAAEDWEDFTVEEAAAEFNRIYTLVSDQAQGRVMPYI